MVEILEAVKDGATELLCLLQPGMRSSLLAVQSVWWIHEQIGYNFEEVLEMLLGFSPSLPVQGESRPELVKLGVTGK